MLKVGETVPCCNIQFFCNTTFNVRDYQITHKSTMQKLNILGKLDANIDNNTTVYTQVWLFGSTGPLSSQNLSFNSSSAKSARYKYSVTVTQLLPGFMVSDRLCVLRGWLQIISFYILYSKSQQSH